MPDYASKPSALVKTASTSSSSSSFSMMASHFANASSSTRVDRRRQQQPSTSEDVGIGITLERCTHDGLAPSWGERCELSQLLVHLSCKA